MAYGGWLAGWLLGDGDPNHLEIRRKGGRRGEQHASTALEKKRGEGMRGPRWEKRG